jgi:TolA-binding protein
MAKKKDIEARGDQRLENIEETLTKTEQFIVSNQRLIGIVVLAVVAIILGYFAYQRYYIEPRTEEAQTQIFVAQRFFEADSLDKALYGDGNSLGFIDIVDDYGMTKPGNLANYYAGISFLKKGNFEQAINYLEDFNGDDNIIGPMATGAIGDAYLELGDTSKAAAYYLEAANQRDNELTTPVFLLKAGRTQEMMGNYDKALDIYNRIKMDYSKTQEGRVIDKYIGRATALKERS